MVNVSGLQRRSTYEEVAKAAELDEFRNLIKTPDRLPKTIIDAPSMTTLDPENEEALIQFEKNKSRDGLERSSSGDRPATWGFSGPARASYKTCEAPIGATHR